MPEQISCPSCGATLRVPETLLGKNVKCPKCQNTFRAETQAAAEPEEPEERVAREPAPARASSRRRQAPPEDYDDEGPPPEDEDEDEDRPRRRRRRGSSAAASAVAGPAIALMVVAGLAIALSLLGLLLNMLGVGMAAAGPGPRGGAAQGDFAANAVTGIGSSIFGLCYWSFVLIGAVKMKSLSSYGLAMASCIVAMLPCSVCCLLGLPFGIWGLVMINKPEVKEAFGRNR
jgi:predicted Zn finger-like uncharacterized protein